MWAARKSMTWILSYLAWLSTVNFNGLLLIIEKQVSNTRPQLIGKCPFNYYQLFIDLE